MEAKQVLSETEVRGLIPHAPHGKALVLVGVGGRMYQRRSDDCFHLLDDKLYARPKELAIDES